MDGWCSLLSEFEINFTPSDAGGVLLFWKVNMKLGNLKFVRSIKFLICFFRKKEQTISKVIRPILQYQDYKKSKIEIGRNMNHLI